MRLRHLVIGASVLGIVTMLLGYTTVAVSALSAAVIAAAYGAWLHKDDPDDDRQ